MTRDEILNMPAGREMDALIFEKIFGFEKGTFPVYEPMKSNVGDYMVRPIQEYSTDISAAWEVVEKLTDGIFLNDFSLWTTMRCWKADFTELRVADSNAETAALAICRAALLAVMK